MPCGTYRLPIFKPFAQKLLLKRRLIEDQSKGGINLLIHEKLDWHWKHKGGMLSLIEKYYPESVLFSETNFSFYASEDDPHVAQDQPQWEMNQPDLDALSKPPNLERERPTDWKMEKLAFYVPAHREKVEEYGIHLTLEGIAELAHTIHKNCPNQSIDVIRLAAAYKLYAHELCHAWVEDLCCLIDFSTGENSPLNERRYSKAQQQYNGYIFMEEAICNTAAYGWLHHFLSEDQSGTEESAADFNNGNEILTAFAQWMRKQPKGYQDFLVIEQLPYQNELFVHNLWRLLIEIYQYPKYEARQALEVYFNGNLSFSERHWEPEKDMHCWDEFSLWGGEPPMHIKQNLVKAR